MITAYRDHGHAIAVGMELNPLMAELYGKVTGCSKGKGGSMHFFDPSRNYWGGHGIVGGQVPLGVGLAYGLKYKGLKGACMTFMGDGAVNQGAVHEAYNLAALWELPVVFVIENNGYSMGTSQARSSAGELSQRAEAYGMAVGRVQRPRPLRGARPSWTRSSSGPRGVQARDRRDRHLPVPGPFGRGPGQHLPRQGRDRGVPQDQGPDPGLPERAHRRGRPGRGPRREDRRRGPRRRRTSRPTSPRRAPSRPSADLQKDVYWEADNPGERTSGGRLFFN